MSAASIAERRVLVDAAQSKQKDAAEALTAEDLLNPATNPMVKLGD